MTYGAVRLVYSLSSLDRRYGNVYEVYRDRRRRNGGASAEQAVHAVTKAAANTTTETRRNCFGIVGAPLPRTYREPGSAADVTATMLSRNVLTMNDMWSSSTT